MTNASAGISNAGFLSNTGAFSNAGPGFFSNYFRSGIFILTLSGTSATFTANSYGIYYNITNSGFNGITLPATAAFNGWFVTLRNNTSSYLSITVGGVANSTPASPFTIPPANSVTLAYDGNTVPATPTYVFF
jgi:hypothetical protein